jgi:hypothetical protein
VDDATRIRETEEAVPAPPEAATAGPAGPPQALQRVLAYQRSAGNAAVSRWLLARDTPTTAPSPPASGSAAPNAAPPVPRVSYVFLMGDVKNDNFYLAAHEYFKHMVKGATVVTDKRTLADVISHVNGEGKPVDTLYIVSHANESGNLGFSVDAADLAKDTSGGDRKPRTEFNEVKEANASGSLPAADKKLIDAQTKIQIKGCNIGRSTLMLDALDEAFGGEASVTAPTHTQEYRFYGKKGGAVAYEENLDELFVEEAGVASKSAADLATAFKAKYPMVPEDQWKGLLKKVKKENRSKALWTHTQPNPPDNDAKSVFARLKIAEKFPKSAGWVPTYKGRTDIGGKWQYDVEVERVLKDGSTEFKTMFITAQIPPTEADLLAQEKAKHGRPDAYTWRVKKTVTGNELKLEVIAEATEWVIEGTIKDASGPYHPAQTDKDWYRTSTFAPPPPAPPKTP